MGLKGATTRRASQSDFLPRHDFGSRAWAELKAGDVASSWGTSPNRGQERGSEIATSWRRAMTDPFRPQPPHSPHHF